MNRRLNPEIFGPQGGQEDLQESSLSMVTTRKLQSQMRETQKRVNHLESLIEVVQSQLANLNHNLESRQDHLSQALSSLEKEIKEKTLENHRQRQQMTDHFRDQRIKDNQMESMVDRFNTSISQFENKINALQKVISEKEMTLMTYRKVMEQIIDEVEKLKLQQTRQRKAPSLNM